MQEGSGEGTISTACPVGGDTTNAVCDDAKACSSGKALLVSNSGKSLAGPDSGKRFDKKKYVKQVTGRHNDTELHLAAQRGDVGAIRRIMAEIDAQITGTLSGAEFDAEGHALLTRWQK